MSWKKELASSVIMAWVLLAIVVMVGNYYLSLPVAYFHNGQCVKVESEKGNITCETLPEKHIRKPSGTPSNR